jgi:membrane protease subunit HflC
MKTSFAAVLVVLVVLLVLASMSLFVVDQRQKAIVFRLGEVVSIKSEPGLYWKLPVVEDVRFFDIRIHTVDADEPERFLTSEKKNVLVDSFVKWRISDVKQYYVSVGGDARRARDRLSKTVNDSLRAEFGKRTVHQVISGERDDIIELMRAKVDEDAAKIGVKVLDVRLKRVDLTKEISDAVYRRMEAERKRVANELRSTGFADAEKIRADADRDREIIVANAYGDAQKVKGDGDAQAAALYARSFKRDPEFYSYYRSLEAYRQSFRNKSDLLILEPGSDFFKYMKSPRGGK